MNIWANEIKDLEVIYKSLKGRIPDLENELERLIKADDENMLLVYSRRCLEVIITVLCQRELRRDRGTEPLQRIIDKLNKEKLVPHNIIVSMQGVNSMSTFGAHPKQFELKQVKSVIINLTTILEWYLKYMQDQKLFIDVSGASPKKQKEPSRLLTGKSKARKKISKKTGVLITIVVIVVLVVSGILVSKKKRIQEISIAVLPLENLTGQDKNEYIANGIHAELISELSKLTQLRVISKTSSSGLGNMLMKDIARRLNVDMVVEASLVGFSDNIKILLKVVDVFPEERPILTKDYNSNFQEIMGIYTSAAQDIAHSLHLNLTDDEKIRLNQKRKINPESKEAYWRGMWYLGKDDPESFEIAIKYLLEAIDKDPADPFAFGAVALGYAIKGHHSLDPEDFIKAGNYANRALELDSTIAEAYTARAMLNLYQSWDWEKAKNAFTEALKMNPNDDVAHAHFAWYYVIFRDFEKAIYHAKQSVILNPLYTAYNSWLAAIYFNNNDYENAEIYAKKDLAVIDTSFYADAVMAWINLERKDYPEAIRFTEKLSPVWDYDNVYRAYTYSETGDKEKALAFYNESEKMAEAGYVYDSDRGLMAAVVGNSDEAFKYLNKAVDNKEYGAMFLTWYPFTEGIRNDPRFNVLLKRMNLPPLKKEEIY